MDVSSFFTYQRIPIKNMLEGFGITEYVIKSKGNYLSYVYVNRTDPKTQLYSIEKEFNRMLRNEKTIGTILVKSLEAFGTRIKV